MTARVMGKRPYSAQFQVSSREKSGSRMDVPRHTGHLPGFVTRSLLLKTNPQALH